MRTAKGVSVRGNESGENGPENVTAVLRLQRQAGIDDSQSVEQEVFIRYVDRFAFGDDQAGEAAGGDDFWREE